MNSDIICHRSILTLKLNFSPFSTNQFRSWVGSVKSVGLILLFGFRIIILVLLVFYILFLGMPGSK